jgi:hypothetical protein
MDNHHLEVFKRELEEKEEARRVITTLFQMRGQKEHGETIQKFITDVLLRDEKQGSIFSWTEERMNASLQTYLDFQPSEPANFKTLVTGITNTDSSPCGQSECKTRKRKHTAESCWILHPELRLKLCAQTECQRKRLRHSAEKCWILHPELKSHKANSSSQSEEEDDDEDDEEDEGDK